MTLTSEGLIDVPGLASRWVRLPSGCRAHYSTSGDSGPSIVLLHGGIIGSSGAAGWRHMAPFLGAHGFRVYCPDMPGFGLTTDPAESYAAGEAGHVDFLHDFVQTLCLDDFSLAGNSMGCSNAINFLLAHPECVTSFILIAGAVGDVFPMSEMRKLDRRTDAERPNIARFDGSRESMRAMLEAIVLDPNQITDDLVDMRVKVAERTQVAYGRHRAAMMRAQTDPDPNLASRLRTKGRLDAITIPGLFLQGRQDFLVPAEAVYPAEDLLRNIQFFYPDDTGHQGQTDQPELFNQLALEFFGSGRVSWATAQRAGISTRHAPIESLIEIP